MGSCCGADKEAVAEAMAKGGFGARALGFVMRIQAFLESWPVLAAAALSLVASLVINGQACGGHAECGTGGAFWRDPALMALILCGLPVLKEAVTALAVERRIRASLLISTAMVACVSIGQVFAAGEVAFIMALGQKLEGWTVKRAKKGLTKLVSLVPATARYVITCPKCLARGEKFRDVPVEKVEVGDGVRILPGETVPVDGVVTEGATTIDQSAMTGESLPVDKAVGDEVYSGTVNRFGAITIRATKAGEDSSLQRLIRLVREAEKKKAPMQRIADKWAAILVPCALTLAALTFLGVWALLGDVHAAMLRGVTILVVFCPCALALATPTSVMAAIGQAAKRGVIVKSGEALERMGGVGVACFDKTGTLTAGRLGVCAVRGFGGVAERAVLEHAAAAESSSEHPVARAIVDEFSRRSGGGQGQIPSAENFSSVPGKGIAADVGGVRILCGNGAWMAENGVAVPGDGEAEAEALRRDGMAVILVAADGRSEGFIALSDTIREDAAAMLALLPGAGLRPVLVTGDHASTARHIAERLSIGDVRAELLPAGKAEEIRRIQSGGERVAMIGDGVNDALALETADVGIAMGAMGSDIAVEAADVALMGDDLAAIPYLKRLSVACVRLIKFNISLSMTINACAITLSVLGLLSPVTGALVHNLGSLLVVFNAAMLYDRKV